MKTVAVIVTYSDRFHLLEQVINSCIVEGISKLIIVDNNSHFESKEKLKKLQLEKKDILFIIWNKENLGSAKGYKQGLEYVENLQDCNFVWLLDDDNQPQKNSLKLLKDYWAQKPKDVAALLSFRPDRKEYKQAVLQNNPNLVLSKRNSFYGFHIIDKFLKPFKKVTLKENNISFGEIAYAPFGGMFFHKTLLNEIGLPDESLYLYSDDHDWSYRITEAGKKIHVLINSIVVDIDLSWALSNSSKKKSVFSTIKTGSPFRIYYTIRNRMVFEKRHLISSKIMYNLNRLFFTIILYAYCFNSQNFKIFLKAVRAAKNNQLGNNYEHINN